MTAGYSAFANLGYKVTPHLIEKIVDADGNRKYVDKLSDADKTLVRDSYFKPSSSYVGEIRRIKFENLLFLGNSKTSIGEKIF
jgi:membrane peptidoglycan carboxypeptidase